MRVSGLSVHPTRAASGCFGLYPSAMITSMSSERGHGLL
jgi:hypothetical protein